MTTRLRKFSALALVGSLLFAPFVSAQTAPALNLTNLNQVLAPARAGEPKVTAQTWAAETAEVVAKAAAPSPLPPTNTLDTLAATLARIEAEVLQLSAAPVTAPTESADKAQVTVGGSLVVKGVTYTINADGSVKVGAKTSTDSAGVKRLVRVGDGVVQYAEWGAGQPWAGGGWFTVPADGSKGVETADPFYVTPGPLPGLTPLGTALPNFTGVTLVPGWTDNNAHWNDPFYPADWYDGPNASQYRWATQNAKIVNGALVLSATKDPTGEYKGLGAQIQTGSPSYLYPRGVWQWDVIFGADSPGLVQAPWLYNADTRDEIDFEFISDGLHASPHSAGQFNLGGAVVAPPSIAGQLHRLAIAYDPGKSIEWFLDGKSVLKMTADQFAPGVFPKSPLKAYMQIGPQPWAGGDSFVLGVDRKMTISGYSFTAP